MRKKTIGEVFYLARKNKKIDIKEASTVLDLPEDFLLAIESNDFEALPGPFYVKKSLASYATYLELDKDLVWRAYDTGTLLAYDEIEVSGNDWQKSRRKKVQTSYWPLIYLLSIALAILIGMGYYVWKFQEKQVSHHSQVIVYDIKESDHL